MQGVAQDGHVPRRSRIAVETVDDYDNGGDVVGASAPRFARCHPILRRRWIEPTVITLPNHAGEEVLEDVT